jgi:hypothetical protein
VKIIDLTNGHEPYETIVIDRVYHPAGHRYEPDPTKCTDEQCAKNIVWRKAYSKKEPSVTTLSLVDLSKEIFELNTAQGWNADRDHTEECRESMLALITSEISEALEDVRDGKTSLLFSIVNDPRYIDIEPMTREEMLSAKSSHPEIHFKPIGLPSELADIVIRCLDYQTWWGETVLEWPDRPQLFSPNATVRSRWAAAALHRMDKSCCNGWINGVMWQAYCLAAEYGINLDEVVELKHAYNKTRTKRHGGKTL